MGRFAIPLVMWVSVFAQVVTADPACERIETEEVELIAQEQIFNRIQEYPYLYRHVGKFFKKRMFKRVMEACMSGGCETRTDIFKHVYNSVEKTMRPLRWTTGAMLLFSTSAAAYLTTLREIPGPYGEVAKLGFGFVTLASAASLAYWHEPLRASVRRMSFALFAPKKSPYSDGFSDTLGTRGMGSKEHDLYRHIGIRWNAAMDNLAVTGWFRFTGFMGSAGNARGMIADIAGTFKKPTIQELEFLAHRTARWMVDARGLPGAIPFDNPKIMTELKLILWPSIGKFPELVPAYTYMVRRSLEYWDPQYKIGQSNTIASLYYESLFRSWKLDGSKIPMLEMNIRPPEGLYKEFDRLAQKEREQTKQEQEEVNRQIAEELEANEKAKNQEAMEEAQMRPNREAEMEPQPSAENAPPPSENQVDPTSGAAPFEGPGGE